MRPLIYRLEMPKIAIYRPTSLPGYMQVVQTLQRAMHQLSAYRIDETLWPASQPLRIMYAFQSPDRLSYQLSTGGQTVIVGSTRFSRSTPTGRWIVEATLPVKVPEFAWDSGPMQDARIVDESGPGAEQVVSFFEASNGTPVWFRLVVDSQGLVREAEMRARGHFMDHRYFDLNAGFSILPPAI